jgi:hypothetical protein
VSLPRPEAGLVVRYSYLWHADHQRGQEEGVKDRPCAIILAVAAKDQAGARVWLLPVTHHPPADIDAAIEIPPVVKQRLGLDSERSWIILGEWNECRWPSPDVRVIGRGKDASFAYGFLPPRFFDHLRRRFVALARRVIRTE